MPRKTADTTVENPPTETPSTEPVAEAKKVAPIIPAYKSDDKAAQIAHYEGRTRAMKAVLVGEPIAPSDYAQIMSAQLITKPGFEGSVYELTPKGIKELSSGLREDVAKQNTANKSHNDREFKTKLPEITAYLVQNKDVVVNILEKGVSAFRNQTPEQRELVKPMHVALDRVKVGEQDYIAGLNREVWSELNKPAYKENVAAQEIVKAAEKALDKFNDLRDRFDQYLRIQDTMTLALEVLERKTPVRRLSDAQQKLLQVKIEGSVHNLISKTAPELTEQGRQWVMQIRETSQNLKAEASLMLDRSAKNSRDRVRAVERAEKSKTPAAPSI